MFRGLTARRSQALHRTKARQAALSGHRLGKFLHDLPQAGGGALVALASRGFRQAQRGGDFDLGIAIDGDTDHNVRIDADLAGKFISQELPARCMVRLVSTIHDLVQVYVDKQTAHSGLSLVRADEIALRRNVHFQVNAKSY